MVDKHYTYLLLNIVCVIFPFLLSFDKKVAFYKSWKYSLPAIFTTGIFYVLWDMVFTAKGVWWFNADYITGLYLGNLPIEEVIFFLCVPYSCVFIYEVLNAYISRDVLGACGKKISILMLVITLFPLLLYYDRLYTVVNAGICMAIVYFSTFVYRFRNLGRFYLAFFVSLIPFLLCDGFITSLPIVSYDDTQNMGLRVGTIPVEDFYYCLSMLMCSVTLMDYLKQRKQNND